ncbi:uncharacterized protein LOC131231034 [Magnolia sinica]|uniref:uncharacterized protein LOC131231034 n=1 Tax=Magnolia sinica TaxID=86752 RepID=UPI00265B168A|nr:uncharacterized protein LOC131231034 [Magnolia sinica]
MSGRMRGGNLTNPCLTMHQPWASLLVYGIKRIEGRSWPAPIRGRLWIHAAGKVPDQDTIKAMEDFYREIYAVNGVTDLKFPEHYPVSRLLGCVEVVGCVKREELVCWEDVPEGVRLEGQTDFCWLCEQPQKLLVPFEMRGYQGVYNLEKKIYEAAVRGLCPIEGPLPVKFPLPDPSDPFSLKPGSLALRFNGSNASEVEKPPSLNAAIAGARAAATQFSKKEPSKNPTRYDANFIRSRDTRNSTETSRWKDNGAVEEDKGPSGQSNGGYHRWERAHQNAEENSCMDHDRNSSRRYQGDGRNFNQQLGASSKIFAAAMKGLKPAGANRA